MKRPKWIPGWISATLALSLAMLSGHAGVTVTQNVSPGATSWPGSPILSTVSNPSSQATIGESFNGGIGGNTNLSETFTITTTNYTLQTIDLYVGGGSGTGTGTNITLNLFDLGSQTAPNPSAYVGGANLLGSGAGLPVSYNNQANGVLELDFSGVDQAVLQAGHMYALELSGVINTIPMYWQRGTSDTYAGDAAYPNRSWINGSNARDFAMAVYGAVNTNPPPPPPPAQCTVDWNDLHQRIDGFGASSAWQSSWTTAWAHMFFSTNTGTGTAKNGSTYSYTGIALSLLRNHIVPDGAGTTMTTAETNIMQMARDRGARVWSAPWTPPIAYKDSGTFNGGNFVSSAANYQGYASKLARYVATMKNVYSIDIYALSVQNEPDANVTTYEACKWTSAQIHDFTTNLYAALVASNVSSTKILIAESQNWKCDLTTNSMKDATSSNMVGILAAHSYGSPEATVVNNYGKALWETEDSLLDGTDSSISNGVYWATEIHNYMTVAEANAWHYWWLITGNTTGNQGLADTNWVPAKRIYTVGNFSRFVRPNYYRIGVNNNAGALISAYKDTNSGNFAIVAINSGRSSTNLAFTLTNFNATSVIPWITSTNLSLASQPAVGVVNSAFTYTLPGVSLVTFVGQAGTNTPPTLMPVMDQVINAGVTLVLTNAATDPNVPPQTLTFSLLNGPTNSTLDASSGVLSWRPLVSQADTTNVITVRVADDGSPSLIATNSFTVRVNPLSQPVLGSITAAGGLLSFVANGALGPDYTVLTSTNLTDWQVLLTTNSPVMPSTIVISNVNTGSKGFYRIQLGP